ncbi:hypothetical protein EG329_010848 [Mollisiaceae sp. DMI_Dod_QoI]|nr:hypothetical protein EG329_010848 [Helotiales sp. DMI_Dod_QoI]
MKLGLESKVVVVTGGSKGIGRAICQGFLEEGAIVYWCCRDADSLDKTDALFKETVSGTQTSRAHGQQVDVSVLSEVQEWIAWIFAMEKHIDVVVSNVSSISVTNDPAAWQKAYQTDMLGTVTLINAALPYLEKSKGNIITISSVSGRDVDFTAPSPYGAFKAALIHYTSQLAHTLASKGVRANTVSPGNIYIEDGVWGGIEKNNSELFKSQLGKNPMGRMGKASEVADTVVWLSSGRAGFISGSNLVYHRYQELIAPLPFVQHVISSDDNAPSTVNHGVWTSWLPLTTAWTSQAGCNSEAWVRVTLGSARNQWPYIYDPGYGESVANTLTCLPPQATQWWEGQSTVSNTVTSWSIGPIVCPAAYTTFSTISVDDTSTSIICCPTSYGYNRSLSYNGGVDGVCTSTIPAGRTLVLASPLSNSYPLTTTTFTSPGLMIAVPVEGYNFAALSLTTSSSPSPSSTPSPAPTSTSNTATTNPPTETASSSGLSTGAKAGIGVGVALGALLIFAGLGFLFFRRRRGRDGIPRAELEQPGEGKSGNEVPGSRSELGGGLRSGPESGARMVEVDGGSRPVEMQG